MRSDPSSFSILLLPGDGIGPEVCAQTRRVMDWFAENRGLVFQLEEDKIGGACLDAYGVPLRSETIEKARACDAVLLGAVGGPQWDGVARKNRPEAGLLGMRKALDLYANLRPARCFPGLESASSLKRAHVSGLDLLLVRELTSGVYFGQPRGMQHYEGQERCVDTQAYSREEIQRIAAIAFELARQRHGRLHSVDKANVMETGAFWRQLVTEYHQRHAPDIALTHMYADNCAMQLVRDPKQFDVLCTDNLFGDILSDCAAMLTGSLGMLPSASLGPRSARGWRPALYEPVHGSAPDLAGRGEANPLAMVLSFGMLLRYSWGQPTEADLLEQAVADVLSQQIATPDIATPETKRRVSTRQMTDELLAVLQRLEAEPVTGDSAA